METRSTVRGPFGAPGRWTWPRIALLATLIAVGSVVAPAAPASADSGDGNVACNFGEICFRNNDLGTDVLRKHFWFDANHHITSGHGAYKWWNASGGFLTVRNVMDDADQMRNRDTVCTVRVWNVDGFGNWFWYTSQGPGSSSWIVVSEINNGHSRCSNPAPIDD